MIFALALGVAFSNGNVARVEINHNGLPVEVQIVALDINNKEIEVSALPSTLIVGNGRPRKARILIPSNATALCAAYQSPSARLLSCSAQLNLLERNRSTGSASRAGSYLSTLQRALDALRRKETEPTLRLSVPPMGTTHE